VIETKLITKRKWLHKMFMKSGISVLRFAAVWVSRQPESH